MNGLFKAKEKVAAQVVMVDISLVVPNRSQPRAEFSDEALKSLAVSVLFSVASKVLPFSASRIVSSNAPILSSREAILS